MLVERAGRPNIPVIYRLILNRIPDRQVMKYSDLRRYISQFKLRKEEIDVIIKEMRRLKLIEDEQRFIRILKGSGNVNIGRAFRFLRVILWQ